MSFLFESVRELQISPDGKHVAFRVREPADPKLPRAPRTTNIWIVSTDGKEPPHPLIPNLKNANTPRWSPDGRWLAFLSDHENSDVNPVCDHSNLFAAERWWEKLNDSLQFQVV